MGCLSFVGNIIWVILGGLIIFLEYFVLGIIFCCTIVLAPIGLQLLKLGVLAIWPFGRNAEKQGEGNKLLNTIGYIIWFIPGLILFVEHIFFGLIFGITIIGIPFAKQHFKLAKVAIDPFDRKVDSSS